MSFDRYLHDDNYGAGQPGVRKIDYNRGREQIVAKLGNTKQRMMRALGQPAKEREYQILTGALVSGAHDAMNAIQKRGMQELASFEKSGGAADATEFPTIDERNLEIARAQNRLYEELRGKCRNVYALHFIVANTTVTRPAPNSAMGKITALIGTCLWCAMTMLSEMRMVILDLNVMAQANTVKLSCRMTMGNQITNTMTPGRQEPEQVTIQSSIKRRRGPANTNVIRRRAQKRGLFVNASIQLKVTPKQLLEWIADGVGVYGDDGLVAASDLDMEATD
jgi:hypothetical protein